MARPIQTPESLVNLVFPNKGIDRAREFHNQPPGTTPTGQNVRAFDAQAKRMRGGSRPGLTRYLPLQVNGENLIQHLNVIVDPTVAGTWPNLMLDGDFGFNFDPGWGNFLWNPGTTFQVDPLTGLDVRVGGSGAQPQSGTCVVTYRQSASGQWVISSSGRSLGFNSAVTIGNLIVVATAGETSNGFTVAVTDTLGNSYTKIFTANTPDPGSGDMLTLWTTISSNGGSNTVTVTPSNAQAQAIAIAEYRCVDSGTPEGTNGNVASNATTATTGTIAVSTVGKKVLLIAAFTDPSGFGVVFTPSGMTVRESVISSSDLQGLCFADKIATSTGEALTATMSIEQTYYSGGASFTPD